jgi:hypothetical protein
MPDEQTDEQKKKAVVVLIALHTLVLAGQALAEGQELEYKSNADD